MQHFEKSSLMYINFKISLTWCTETSAVYQNVQFSWPTLFKCARFRSRCKVSWRSVGSSEISLQIWRNRHQS